MQQDTAGDSNHTSWVVGEKLLQAALKKVDQQFYYISAGLKHNGTEVFPDRPFISSHVFQRKRFHFSASTKLENSRTIQLHSSHNPATITLCTTEDSKS